jgi:LmbE family N-acetylglucosaminyl deacetylase
VLGRERPDLVLAPQGLGGHVDHRQVILALLRLGVGQRAAWWADLPYAMREPDAAPDPSLPAGLEPVAVPVGKHLGRKAEGVACYGSQLGFQFKGRDAGAELAAFAEARGRGLGVAVETFLAGAEAAASIREWRRLGAWPRGAS